MQIKTFFQKFIKKNYFNKNFSEYDELFLGFIKNGSFDKAELMVNNNFIISPNLSHEINKLLLSKMYTNNIFLSLDQNLIKDEIKSELDNDKSLNLLIKFLVKNDLLGLDFLFVTQDITDLLKDTKNHKTNTDKSYIQQFKELKFRPSTTIYLYSPDIFTSSINFDEFAQIDVKNGVGNDFLSLSNYRSRISLKDFCNLSESQRKHEKHLREIFPNLNNSNIDQLFHISNSCYFSNILIFSQLSRHLVQKAINNKECSAEDLINKIYNSKKYQNTPLKKLIYTVGFLEPNCIKNLDKKIALDILTTINDNFKIKDVFYSQSQILAYKKFFQDIKDNVDGKKILKQNEDQLLNKFLSENKSVIFKDYIQLAQSMNFDTEIITTLKNTKKISDSLLITLQQQLTPWSLEHQQYIKQSNDNILKAVYEYEQIKDFINSNEKNSSNSVEETYFLSLQNIINEFKEELKNIMNQTHQHNINLLDENKKILKTQIR